MSLVILKMKNVIDREILEIVDWNFDYSIGVLCAGLKKAGFNEKVN